MEYLGQVIPLVSCQEWGSFKHGLHRFNLLPSKCVASFPVVCVSTDFKDIFLLG